METAEAVQPESRSGDGEFMGFLLEKWESEGKHASSFHKKVWRWLTGERPAQNPAERRYVQTIKRWAFDTGANSVIWQQRKARGYYNKSAA